MRRLLLLLLLAALGCQPARPGLGRPHVVLVVADTLRADHVGPWGAPAHATPFLDELAARSIVFEDSTSASSQTVPSVLSLWTGRYPVGHGNRYFPATNSFRVARAQVRPRVDGSAPLLQEQLAAAGYATAAIVTNPWLQRRYGFDRGFEVYRELFARGDLVRGRKVNEAVATLIDELRARPLFLYVHYMDTHPPFDPEPEYPTPFMDGLAGVRLGAVNHSAEGFGAADIAYAHGLYAASVRALDERLRELHALLRARFEDDLLFVLVGDHGEEFAEHGGLGHGYQLFQESVRVPLLVSHPALAPRRITAPTGGVDVLPTLLDLLALPAPEGVDGISLAPSIRGEGEPAERAIFSELGERVAIRVGARKLIAHREAETDTRVFDLEADPGETSPVAERPAALLAAWRAFASRVPAAASAAMPESLDAESEARLRALGYLGGEADP
jgi:arylsulfatase